MSMTCDSAPPRGDRPADSSWGDEDFDPQSLRRLLGRYPTGVAIVTTRTPQGRAVGLTINSFASLSLVPPLILWSLLTRSSNLEVFRSCNHFAINTLCAGQLPLAQRFASSTVVDKFAGVPVRETPEGIPVIDRALATLVCVQDHSREIGDHLLVVGRVVRTHGMPGAPLVFHGGKFTRLADNTEPAN
jgi:flavin reductase (DIM6/NTAB) family NADH-FMN oxidoreductase RutF